MISFVVCSVDAAKLNAFQRHIDDVMNVEPHELVSVIGPESLASGYIDGLGRTTGDLVIFCHDDIQFMDREAPVTLKRHLSEFDVLGVAGTDKMAGASWGSAGPPHLFGQVVHRVENGYRLCIYNAPRPAIGGIQALDGLFLAFRREVIEKVGWDAVTFDGFHHYDLDTTFRAFQMGFKLGVACDLPIFHASSGTYDEHWQKYAHRFLQKHGSSIAPRQSYLWNAATIEVRTKQEALAIMRPRYWSE